MSSSKEKIVEHGNGVVKAVESGDSIIVYETAKARNGPPPERQISLSMLSAPRIARRGGNKDSDWGWASREFLRSKVVGKNVTFTIEHKTEGKDGRKGREYGTVHVGEVNLVKLIAAEGWAAVRKPAEGKEPRNELHKELLALSTIAEEKKVGIFQEDRTGAQRKIPESGDAMKLFDSIKDKPQPAIVEYVRDGTNMRVTLLNTFHSFMLRVSGAEAPNIPPAHKNQAPQPFALESKFFVERYVLQRNVQVTVRVPGRGNYEDEFYGMLNMEGKDLGEELVRQGLAKFVEWSAPPARKEILRQLEQQARNSNLRIWKYAQANREAASAAAATMKEWEGRVREVRDGSSLVIVNTSVNPPQKVNVALSSIVAPRFGRNGHEDEDYAYEAKELLRNKVLGKKVRVVVDFVKPATVIEGRDTPLPEKEFCSVYLGNTSVALFLVEEGFVRVSGARDQPQSAVYEQLMIAEKRAESKEKGRWSEDEAPRHYFNDVTQRSDPTSASRARALLPAFKRDGRAKGSVEWVVNGSRIKVLVPKQNTIVMVGLEAIRTPSGRGDNKDPLADEVNEYVREKLHQRNVELLVNDVDKGGNFIGSLWLNNRNFGTQLLEKGYASVNERSVEYSRYCNEYKEAEEKAKEAKLGIWQFEVNHATPKVVASTASASSDEKAKPQLASVQVTEVVDGGNFYAQRIDDVEKLEALMAKLNDGSAALGAYSENFRRNQLCLAKFAADGKWYRAKILESAGHTFEVNYIDYGNVADVKIDDMRILAPEYSNAPPFAKECTLAYVNVPAFDDEYGDEAAEYFHGLVWGKKLLAGIEGKDGDQLSVTLGDPQTEQMVNLDMVAAGMATVEKYTGRKNPILVKKLTEAQKQARENHSGMWQYGDFLDEE